LGTEKRDEQLLEAAQMKFLRHLLGITKLDKEKYLSIRKKHSKGNKIVPAKVATTCTEDGHKQTTKAGTALWTKRKKEPRTTKKRGTGMLSIYLYLESSNYRSPGQAIPVH
jgi:hypothetical protein